MFLTRVILCYFLVGGGHIEATSVFILPPIARLTSMPDRKNQHCVLTFLEAPVSVLWLGGGVTELAVGNQHVCARMTDGSVKCGGANAYGQLGDGNTTTRTSPVSVIGLTAPISPSDCLFNRIEAAYATYFAPASGTSTRGPDYCYRYYSATLSDDQANARTEGQGEQNCLFAHSRVVLIGNRDTDGDKGKYHAIDKDDAYEAQHHAHEEAEFGGIDQEYDRQRGHAEAGQR